MQEGKKKRLFSGVKPTGRPHIGNYFGAMQQWLELQGEYDCFFMVADYHALTTLHAPHEMREGIEGVATDYLAIGLNPATSVLFKQSDVPAHTEATWIFNCITTMPQLMRAHAFKDAEAKNKDLSVGTFDYPLLMAADIILYDTDIVPVGKDQEQHVEIARDTAEKFNRLFGVTFTLPEAKILSDRSIVPGVDGRKMSKSYGNTIPLFAEKDDIARLVTRIVTDSTDAHAPKDPATDTLFALHRLVSVTDLTDLEKRYREGTISYQESKEILIENLEAFIAPLREKRCALAKDPALVAGVLTAGKERAWEITNQKMKKIREKIGVSL